MNTLQQLLNNVRFIIVDQRTGLQACSGVWSEAVGNGMIEQFRRRQRNGGRPDISAEAVANLILRETSEYRG